MLSSFIQEEEEASEAVDLLYVALKAVLKEKIPLPLVRRIFELRLLSLNGLYAPPSERGKLNESAFFALNYVTKAPCAKLFSFALSVEAMRDFSAEAARWMGRSAEASFKSLELIDEGF